MNPSTTTTLTICFLDSFNTPLGDRIAIPRTSTPEQLQLLLANLQNSLHGTTDSQKYTFTAHDQPITGTLDQFLLQHSISSEKVLDIQFHSCSLAPISAVTRCTSSLPGHSAAILVVRFSTCGNWVATGSGDNTVKIWDTATNTLKKTVQTHKGWVQALAWHPLNPVLLSGGYHGFLSYWTALSNTESKESKESKKNDENPITKKAHSKAVMDIAWEPLQALRKNSNPNFNCLKFVTGGRDGSVKVWRSIQKTQFSLSGHSESVTSVCWGAQSLIYSAGRDSKIKVWNGEKGILVRILSAHAHWVNHLSVNTERLISREVALCDKNLKEVEKLVKSEFVQRFKGPNLKNEELLVSGSDDHTAYLWAPESSSKPRERLLGHQQAICFVRFSPDGRFICTASFDKSVRLWDCAGKFLRTFRGHVGAIHQLCWSSDSRMIVTGSKDSTVKVWSCFGDMKRQKRAILNNLPGHLDEVYAVDWSLDGSKVASGGKDGELKIWAK